MQWFGSFTIMVQLFSGTTWRLVKDHPYCRVVFLVTQHYEILSTVILPMKFK